jgi:hypothetical protein
MPNLLVPWSRQASAPFLSLSCTVRLGCILFAFLTECRQEDMDVVRLGLNEAFNTAINGSYGLRCAHLKRAERPDNICPLDAR